MSVDPEEVTARLSLKKMAYTSLRRGAEDILQDGYIYWTERLLLRLVRHLADVRLNQLGVVMPNDEP